MSHLTKVAIIGGGIAGISTAYFLHKNGFTNIELFESSHKLGGRTSTSIDFITGNEIDNGKHLVSRAYETFFELLKFFNTNKQSYFKKIEFIPIYAGEMSYKVPVGKIGFWETLISYKDLWNYSGDKFSEKFNFLKLLVKFKLERWLSKLNFWDTGDLQNKTVAEFLNENKQSSKIIKHLWEPITLATLNAPIDKAPAELFITVLKKAFFSDELHKTLYVPSSSFRDIIFDSAKIQHICKINLKSNVEKIQKIDEKWRIFVNQSHYEFDAIVLAVAPMSFLKIIDNSQLQNLFEEKLLTVIKEYEYSPIISVYFWYPEELFSFDMFGLIDSKFQWIFKEGYKRYTMTMSVANELVNLSKTEIRNIALNDVKTVFKHFRPELVEHFVLITERYATVLFNPINNKKRMGQKVCKGLYVAGDWTNTKLPATIESAALSGKLAAEFLINDFK